MVVKEKIALEILSIPIKNCSQIIASTKPLEGLPLLVIEDEIIGKPLDDYIRSKASQDKCIGFIEGYKTSQKSHPYSEMDMISFHVFVDNYYANGQNKYKKLLQLLEDWKAINKKELWIEVELNQIKASDKTGYDVSKVIPKITNGQLKAIWK
jgi:hypothetical protein